MDFNTTKSLKKQTSLKKKDRNLTANAPQKLSDKIFLEKVLGLTVRCNSHIAVHEASSQCAYLAGSVAVILNSLTNKQTHVINTCRKTLSSIDFLHDGSHVATGEAGHQPAVRVWNIDPTVVADNGGFGVQVSELVGHSFGIPVVAFAPYSSLLVSVGNQHDMDINVWNWRTGVKVASNKVSAKVQTISFSEDGKWFVTCGVRHVRFWYIEKTVKNLNVEPLKGKAALLGEKKTLSFCDVATGKGLKSGSCFAVSREGILCEFNAKRHLNKWVELRTTAAYCVVVGKKYIFCGCADGVIRVFEVLSLDYLATFPKPHFLGVQISACTDSSHLVEHPEDARYPDCVAISMDEVNQKLYACYSDHSLYIWDVFNLNRIGKFSSFLFHSGPVRDVKVYPDLEVAGPLPAGSFLTCGNDNTLRIWNLYPHSTLTQSPYEPNVYSNELVDVVYIDADHLIEAQESLKSQQHHASLSNLVGSAVSAISGTGDTSSVGDDYRTGLRCMTISDTGSHIAVGDRQGNVRIYDAAMLYRGELVTLEAHDSEVLALEYSPSYVEVPLLATASRDRLLHVLSVDDNYDLVKTLPDHSSSISGVKFLERDNVLHLVSCAADKSLVFRSANCNSSTVHFNRDHIVAEKTTFYDLVTDTDNGLFIAACQDRNIRFYDCQSSKLLRTFKGSEAEDGNLSRLAIDPSHKFLATCGSDKSISLIDKQTGDIVATVFGHSESITGLTFTQDSKRLISTCADSCIFVWKLSKQITQQIGATRPTQTRIETRSVQMQRRGIPAKARGRIQSESQKPIIEDVISLDENDPELPAWLKKSSNRVTGGSSTFGALGASTSLSAGLNSEDLINPRSKWADRASEQLSLAASVNVDGEDITSLFPPCDPHEVFAGSLSVQRCHSGSDSNGSSISSATNLTEDKNAQCTLFDLEDVEVSADEEDDDSPPKEPVMAFNNSALKEPAAGRPGGLDLTRSAFSDKGAQNTDKIELPTPSVEELPRPIFPEAKRKDAARIVNDAGNGDRNGDDGYMVNVSPENPQLSPDSVDRDFSSEDDAEWSSNSFRAEARTTQVRNAVRNDTLVDMDDDLDLEGGSVARDNDEDGDDEDIVGSLSTDRQPSLGSQNSGSGRRNSLTSQHLTQMSTRELMWQREDLSRELEETKIRLQTRKSSAFALYPSKLSSRLRKLVKPSPLLISKKTVADIRKDEPSQDLPTEDEVSATQEALLSPKMKPKVADVEVVDAKQSKAGKLGAFSHGSGKIKQPGFSSKVSANRPSSMNTETDAGLTSNLKSSKSFRVNKVPSFVPKPLGRKEPQEGKESSTQDNRKKTSSLSCERKKSKMPSPLSTSKSFSRPRTPNTSPGSFTSPKSPAKHRISESASHFGFKASKSKETVQQNLAVLTDTTNVDSDVAKTEKYKNRTPQRKTVSPVSPMSVKNPPVPKSAASASKRQASIAHSLPSYLRKCASNELSAVTKTRQFTDIPNTSAGFLVFEAEFGQKDISSKGDRSSRGSQKNSAVGAVSSPVSRDRSLDPEAVSVATGDGASPMLGYQNGTRKKANKSQQNSNDQSRPGASVNLKRYNSDVTGKRRQMRLRSDTTIARNVMSVSSNSSNVNLNNASRQLGASSTSLASTAQPGYAKATRSSNLKTTGGSQTSGAAPVGSTKLNQRPNALPSSAAYLTADSIRKAAAASGDLSEDSLDERSSLTNSTNSTKNKKTSKGLSKKFLSATTGKTKLKSWKSADSLANSQNKLSVAYSKDAHAELDFTDSYKSREGDDVQVCSPANSKTSSNNIKNILTPTNPDNIYTNEDTGRTFKESTVTAPCLFCIRKETTMDDDEGFVSNEYNRYERCVCSPEQLMRMRPPKNTDPGLLSDSDLEDSDTRSGSDYFVSQQDLNLAGCQRAVNRLNHTFKVVSGYHQQAECCDEKEEIIQLLTDTCTQIQHSMFARGMVPRDSYHVAADDLQQLRSKLELASQQGLASSRSGNTSGDVETSATLNLLQHYSDMLVTLFQRQLATDDASTTVGGSGAAVAMGRSASSFSYNYPTRGTRGSTDNDQANDQDDNENESSVMTEDGAELTSQEMSHAPSNETLEDV